MLSFEATIAFELYTPVGVVEVEPGDVIFSDGKTVRVFTPPKTMAAYR